MTALEETLREHTGRLEELQSMYQAAQEDCGYVAAAILEQDIDEIQSQIAIMNTEVKAGKFLD
jgi:hypothetical protein